jgi:nucleotide-binding universal stress UspA family protein
MFSDIVVGTDGSETAKAGVTLAIELARHNGATVHLVHAFKFSRDGASIGHLGDPALSAAVKDAVDAVLAEAAAAGTGVTVETHAATIAPADAVIQVAEEVDADLVVVGSKGMRGGRRAIGSVANSVAHRAPCHVLIAKTA